MNEDNLKAIAIPPNPDHEYFNCRKTNQNALRGETFWVLDYHRKIVRYDDGREAEKYILLCRRHLDGSSENNFKFFTGSIDIKYKLDICREQNKFPIRCKLVGDNKDFDIVDLMSQ